MSAGPGHEGQLTPVSRAAAARAANASSDVSLLMRPLPQDAPAAKEGSGQASPAVKSLPPVPFFDTKSLPASAPLSAPSPAMSPRTATAAGAPRADEPGPRTPGSAVRRTGLGGTPRRIKSPFPRAPGLSGTPLRVPVAPSPQKTPGAAGGAGRTASASARMVQSAERIAASAVSGDEAMCTPGGTRLWQDAGGIGREAGEDDVMAEAQPEGSDAIEQGGRGVGAELQAPGDAHHENGAENEPGSPVREMMATTPCKAAFTPGGRLRAALSPIPQEDEDEAEEGGGRRASSRGSLDPPKGGAAADEEVDGDEGEDEGASASMYLQPAASSTPGKEFHVRKTCLGGTPVRLAVACVTDDEASSPKTPGGSIITRVGKSRRAGIFLMVFEGECVMTVSLT